MQHQVLGQLLHQNYHPTPRTIARLSRHSHSSRTAVDDPRVGELQICILPAEPTAMFRYQTRLPVAQTAAQMKGCRSQPQAVIPKQTSIILGTLDDLIMLKRGDTFRQLERSTIIMTEILINLAPRRVPNIPLGRYVAYFSDGEGSG